MMNTAVLLAAATVLAQPGGGSPRQYAQLQHCVVSLIDHVQLPAQQGGVLRVLDTKEGQLVKEGDLLGKVDDQEALLRKQAAEHRLAVATQRATNDSELRASKKIVEVAEAEYKESDAINRRDANIIPATQMRRQFLQWERSVLEVAVAETNLEVAKLELKVAEAEVEAVENELKRLQILAPFDGVVTQLYRQASEWVQPGDPVVRVVRMDQLRVEGFLNADEYSPDQVLDADVVVSVMMAGGRKEQFRGKVDFVSPLVEASGDYRIWAEVENRPGYGGYHWLLRPGLEAEMTIQMNQPLRLGVR